MRPYGYYLLSSENEIHGKLEYKQRRKLALLAFYKKILDI